MKLEKPRVKRVMWSVGGKPDVPMIRISSLNHFVIVPFEYARDVVHKVHDLCDDFEYEGK